MKSVAFIPIKLNNERLPGKNLMRLEDGTPLIHLIQKKLIKLKINSLIDEIYIYCSDENIKEYLLPNVKFLKRPKWLDANETLGKDIYNSFVNEVYADIYVLAHATSPFVKYSNLVAAIEAVSKFGYDSSFSAYKINGFLWHRNKPVNFNLRNPIRTQDLPSYDLEISTPYVFNRRVISLYKSRTGINPYILYCNQMESIDIDTLEDFNYANYVYSNYRLIREDFDL